MPVRLLAAAAAAALLAERAGAPCAAGWTPLAGSPERCYRLMRHSDGCPSMVTRSGPFSDQKGCATDWAGCAAMCQAAAVGANSSAVIGSLRDPAAAELLFSLVEGLSDEEDDRHVWIGYNALREGEWRAGGAGARWSWAADPARDATVAGSAPDIAFESQPWFAAATELAGYEYCDEPVGGEACSGPCAGVEQVSDAARGSRRGGALAPPLCASARQCAHSGLCLCEASPVASLRPELDTTDAPGCRTPDVSKCGGCASCRRGMSYPGDCCAPPGDAATCRAGFRPSELLAPNGPVDIDVGRDAVPECWGERDDGRGNFECCASSSNMSRTMLAAHAGVAENDEYDCHMEEYWDVYVAAYSSIYGTMFLSLLIGFLVACKFCAPQQHFSTPIHGCCGDMGQCCLSWWCPCVTWGKIAAFAYPREMTGKEYTGCVIYCCCSDLACCLGMLTRVEVRRRFSIQGDMCQDCCIHCCAHSCALCQELREIELARSGGREPPLPVQMIGMINVAQAPQMITCTCPADAGPGQTVPVQTPEGGTANVVVPAGVGPGQQFRVSLPAAPPPTVVQATVVGTVGPEPVEGKAVGGSVPPSVSGGGGGGGGGGAADPFASSKP